MMYIPFYARSASAARKVDATTSSTEKSRVIQPVAANDTRSNRAQRRKLRLHKLAQSVAKVAITPAVRATFEAQMSASDATNAGRRFTTLDVLSDVCDGLSPAIVRAVVERHIPGFGPLALRYTLDLATELDGRYSLRVAHQRRRATAAAVFVTRSESVYAQRSALAARIDDALAADAPERATFSRVATSANDSLDVALASLDTLAEIAEEIFDRADADEALGVVLADQQFTRGAIEALLAPVDSVIEAREDRRDAADEAQVEQQSIDELEGRVRDQLLRARRCVERARESGVKVPTMTLARLRVSATTSEKQPDQPVDNPTPTPA